MESTGRRTWIGALVIVTSLGAAFGTSFWMRSFSEPASSNAGLHIAEKFLDFGSVWEQKAFRWEIVLENRSKKEVTVQNFAASCSCLAMEPKSVTIPAGGISKVLLTLDLTKRTLQEVGLQTREFGVALIPRIEDGRAVERGWRIRGRVNSPVTIEPRAIYFGDALIRGEPFPGAKARLVIHAPTESLVAKCDPAVASVRLESSGGSGNEYDLTISLNQKMPSGPFRSSVRLEFTGSTPLEFEIPLEGIVKEEVQAHPSAVVFGSRRKGERAEEILVLQSVAGRPFKIERWETNSGDISVERIVVDKVPWAFRVIAHASELGNQKADLKFFVTGTESGQDAVFVPCSYFGLEAEKTQNK